MSVISSGVAVRTSAFLCVKLVIRFDRNVMSGEVCGDEELMEEIITSFKDADNKTLLRLASEWTSLNVSFDDVEFFTLR